MLRWLIGIILGEKKSVNPQIGNIYIFLIEDHYFRCKLATF